MIILPLISAVVSADDDNKVVFEFLEDTDDILESKIFYSKDITITGRAPENTEIKINLYWYRPPFKKSIISREKEQNFDYSSGKWIFIDNLDDLTDVVGASKIFAIPLRINVGKYKIEILAINGDDERVKEIEIEYNDKNQINKEFSTKVYRHFDLDIE